MEERDIVHYRADYKRNGHWNNHVLVCGRGEVGEFLSDADGEAYDADGDKVLAYEDRYERETPQVVVRCEYQGSEDWNGKDGENVLAIISVGKSVNFLKQKLAHGYEREAYADYVKEIVFSNKFHWPLPPWSFLSAS